MVSQEKPAHILLFSGLLTDAKCDRIGLGGMEHRVRDLGSRTGAMHMLGFDRITFDRNVMGGRACIRGMRVTVSLILNLVANGMSTEEIIEAYPYLEPDDIRQALQYAAWLAEESVHSPEPMPA